MKENKEETKLQSEQKTAEIFFDKVDVSNMLSMVCDQFNASSKGREDFIKKVINDYTTHRIHASQFKSQLPIEQKDEEIAALKQELRRVIHEKDKEISRLKSQPLPIEGVEREWISVKDRLPDDASRVLIFGCVKKYGVYAGAYFNFYSGGKWKSLGFEATDVTHWMPLPPPPKEWLATRKGSKSGE